MILQSAIGVLLLISTIYGGEVKLGSVYCKDKICSIKLGHLDKKGATAYGIYNDTMLETGWGQLDIRSGFGSEASDADVMYAAGVLEGAITAWRIHENYLNMWNIMFHTLPEKLMEMTKKWLNQQDEWSRDMVSKYSSSDSFWRQVGHVTAQLDGIYHGYNSVADKQQNLSFFVFQVMNSFGDLMTIMESFNITRPDWKTMTNSEFERYLLRHSRCSAIVKVTNDYSNIVMGHSTWSMYGFMMRIYKFWTFQLQDEATVVKTMSFSSYPGFLISIDDFYIMADTNMVMLQTTNNIFNNSLYDLVTPQSLLAWQRVRVANMAATSGQQWGQLFSRYNSGTYPNQYMVVDIKRFRSKVSLDDGALWVVEQIPGLVVSTDQTAMLRKGYFPSYNVPFYESVYNISGYPDMVATRGVDFSYQMAPRAKIFRRDQGDVHNTLSLQQLLRSNDYQHDEFSEGDACKVICCRGDLRKNNTMAMGCIDTKVTDAFMASRASASIISGPTRGTDLPVFKWADRFPNISHIGLPDKFDFSFYDVNAIL